MRGCCDLPRIGDGTEVGAVTAHAYTHRMFRIGFPRMRRHVITASLLLLGAGLLAGCGQKGPLFLPPTKPATPPPASSAQQPAPASSAPARAVRAASPATAISG